MAKCTLNIAAVNNLAGSRYARHVADRWMVPVWPWRQPLIPYWLPVTSARCS